MSWMKRGAAVAVVVVIGAVGASYWAGGRIERGFHSAVKVLNENPTFQKLVKVELVSYDRSAFSAKAQTRWILTLDGKEGESNSGVTVDHDVSNSPLLLGAAKIISTVNLPADAPPEVVAALAGKPLLTVNSRVNWSKSSSNEFVLPAIQFASEDDKLDWSGAQADVNVSSDASSAEFKFSMPSLLLTSEGRSVNVQGISMSSDMKLAKGMKTLWVGSGKASLDTMAIQSTADDEPAKSVTIKGLGYATSMDVKDGMLSGNAKYEAKDVDVNGYKVQDIVMDVSVDRFNAEAIQSAQNLSMCPSWPICGIEDSEDMGQQLMALLPQLLKDKPVIELKRLSFKTPEGTPEAQMKFSYNGDAANVMGFQKDIHGEVRLSLPKALTDKWAVSAGYIGGSYERYLPQMIAAGIVKESGANLQTEMALDGGQVTVYGKPFEELMMKMQLSEQ